MSKLLGRQNSYGIGKETTAGTAVAAGHWVRHLSADFQPRTDKVMNESANGTVVKYNDSDIVREWADGNIEGKVQADSFGLVLLGAFGSVSTGANGDASGNVYDHTFSISNTATPQTLTIVNKNSNVDRAYALGAVGSLAINVATGDYAKFSMGVTAKKHATASSTVAYVDETEFTSKHTTVKLASAVAGLSGATAIDVEAVDINITGAIEPYFPHGSVAPSEMHRTGVEVSGTMTLLWDSETYENLSYADTKQALEVKMVNSGVTIGTSANPSMTVTLPKVSITEVDVDQSLDTVVKQTINFTGLFDTDESAVAEAVLTNTTSSY